MRQLREVLEGDDRQERLRIMALDREDHPGLRPFVWQRVQSIDDSWTWHRVCNVRGQEGGIWGWAKACVRTPAPMGFMGAWRESLPGPSERLSSDKVCRYCASKKPPRWEVDES